MISKVTFHIFQLQLYVRCNKPSFSIQTLSRYLLLK